jgi:hypothetical protein
MDEPALPLKCSPLCKGLDHCHYKVALSVKNIGNTRTMSIKVAEVLYGFFENDSYDNKYTLFQLWGIKKVCLTQWNNPSESHFPSLAVVK